ncbi:hypothetical protein [Desulfosporosinus youngiae]|uniref:Uncharacterized protein n=1 Tax=Desulfosporosinus youngiae DSM 17734 TaxID=768710 RepID=H5Y234_9FIRM|nr:hypothetical protein [Desulfosporosinus youngiae]EHQ88232.1 hypothetical protein DesyoDRAFT_1061 [Desulfosporosinus youngiae DSM 17734]
MPQLTDQQILDLFQLKAMPKVGSINISQRQDYCGIHVHGTTDADMMPIVKAVKRIVGVEVQLSPIRDGQNGETVQWLRHDSDDLSLTIYSTQTFDTQKIPA